jgi:hypothetical protein
VGPTQEDENFFHCGISQGRRTVHKAILVGVSLFISASVMAAEAQSPKRSATQNNQPAVASNNHFIPPHLSSEAYWQASQRAQQERERYKGITVNPHPQALGATHTFQMNICKLISKLDFVPDARLQRFRWIPQEMNTPITGWKAIILDTAPAADGVLVRIKVTPRHDGNGGFHAPNAFTIESYVLKNNQISYIGLEGPASRGIIIFN